MKQLKLMLDYDCWPLWDQDAGDNLDPEVLPLSDALKARLQAWSDAYNVLLNRDDPMNSYHTSEREQALEQEGVSLWRALQTELGEAWQVFYSYDAFLRDSFSC